MNKGDTRFSSSYRSMAGVAVVAAYAATSEA
jgi:hypothetical protein